MVRCRVTKPDDDMCEALRARRPARWGDLAMTKPNPLHVTVTEHAQPHAALCQCVAQMLTGEVTFSPSAAARYAGELRAAADYIGRREQQWEALRKWLDNEIDQPYCQCRSCAMVRCTVAEMDRLD